MTLSDKQDTKFEDAVKTMMFHVGEDPSREGLLKTPQRVKKAYEFIFGGYKEDPREIPKRRGSCYSGASYVYGDERRREDKLDYDIIGSARTV